MSGVFLWPHLHVFGKNGTSERFLSPHLHENKTATHPEGSVAVRIVLKVMIFLQIG